MSVTDNTGGVTTSTYDGLNRLSSRELSVTGITPLKVIWDYDAAGNVSKLTRQTNGVTVGTTDTSHDILHRTTEIHHKNASGITLGKYEYTSYDAGDRLLSQTIDGFVTSYAYDKTNQLTQDGGTSYSYDANGNRTISGYTVGPNNQIISDGTWTYSYDNASQTSSKSDGFTTWNYNYDHNGQMIEAGNGMDTVTYTFDVFGNRIERSHDDGTTVDVERFAFDGGDTAKPRPVGNEQFDTYADLDSANNVTTRRMYDAGFDKLIVRRDAAGNEGWYLQDKLNSVRAIADDAGSVVATATYSAFGESVTTGAIDRFQYTSQERDLLLGLDYSNARMRDPVTSMFLNEDPMSFAAGDPNLRRYVGNGATNATDPSGLFNPWQEIKNANRSLQNTIDNTWVGRKRTEAIQGAKDLANDAVDFGTNAAELGTEILRQKLVSHARNVETQSHEMREGFKKTLAANHKRAVVGSQLGGIMPDLTGIGEPQFRKTDLGGQIGYQLKYMIAVESDPQQDLGQNMLIGFASSAAAFSEAWAGNYATQLEGKRQEAGQQREAFFGGLVADNSFTQLLVLQQEFPHVLGGYLTELCTGEIVTDEEIMQRVNRETFGMTVREFQEKTRAHAKSINSDYQEMGSESSPFVEFLLFDVMLSFVTEGFSLVKTISLARMMAWHADDVLHFTQQLRNPKLSSAFDVDYSPKRASTKKPAPRHDGVRADCTRDGRDISAFSASDSGIGSPLPEKGITMEELLMGNYSLPGEDGVTILTSMDSPMIHYSDLFRLSHKYDKFKGMEFSLTREVGPNNRSVFRLYSGISDEVSTPRMTTSSGKPGPVLSRLGHNHPSRIPYPSRGDMATINNNFLDMIILNPSAVPPHSRIIWGAGEGSVTIYYPDKLR